MDAQTMESKSSRGARVNADYLRQEETLPKGSSIKISPMISQQPRDKKQSEIEKSAFADEEFVHIKEYEEQKKQHSGEKMRYEDVKLPPANDQGFSGAFRNSTTSSHDQDQPLVSN